MTFLYPPLALATAIGSLCAVPNYHDTCIKKSYECINKWMDAREQEQEDADKRHHRKPTQVAIRLPDKVVIDCSLSDKW